MIKLIILFYISSLVMAAETFFINARDIRRFFGIAPTFYDIYRKEASQNYQKNNQDERMRYRSSYKKYENNINEKLPTEEYYYKRPSPEDVYEYDSEYSNKQEQTSPYIQNEDNNCDQEHVPLIEKIKDTKNKQQSRIQPQFQGTLSKLQSQVDKYNNGRNKDYSTNNDGRNKEFISGILVALPNFNVKEALSEPNILTNKNNEKYFIKALFSNTPQPVYAEENGQPDNIIFR